MKMNFTYTGLLPALLLFCASCATTVAPQKFSGATPLEWSVRLADSEIARRGDSLAWKPDGKAKWDYTAGLFTLALLKLNEQTHDARYKTFAQEAIGSFISPGGQIQTYNRNEFQLDALNRSEERRVGKECRSRWAPY